MQEAFGLSKFFRIRLIELAGLCGIRGGGGGGDGRGFAFLGFSV